MLDTKAAGHKLWFLKEPPCVLKLVFHDNHDFCKGNEEAKAALDCWNISNYVAAIVEEDGCYVRVKEGCWCSICSPLTLLKKEATMVGCWWQPTTIV